MTPVAGVVQWQNTSFPSLIRGFDSPHPLQSLSASGSGSPDPEPTSTQQECSRLGIGGTRAFNAPEKNL